MLKRVYSLEELVLFHYVGFRDWTQDIRLDSKLAFTCRGISPALNIHSLSNPARCFRLILYFPCPGDGISHFSKEYVAKQITGQSDKLEFQMNNE